MRVLHVITMLDTGGAERLMVDLLPSLKEHDGIEVELLLHNGTDTPFKQELKQRGVKISQLGFGDLVDYVWSVYKPQNVLKLKKYIDKFDIIHTHNTACQFYVPMAKFLFGSNAKLVTTEHNSTNRRRLMRWFKPFDHWMYNRYDSIICISDQTRQNLEEYIGKKDTITTIYNGVDIARFLRPIRNIEHNSGFIITMVAAFRDQKDHDTLLRAMKLLPDNYHLRLVGMGRTEGKVKELCSNLALDEKVSFMGMRSDVQDILTESDVVVLSSHWEGLSLSSIEGMASGRPFVASDVDGLHEIVSGAGVLFPHGDEKALAESIKRLCENPGYYDEVAKACQNRARMYDISVMANAYYGLYQSLLK